MICLILPHDSHSELGRGLIHRLRRRAVGRIRQATLAGAFSPGVRALTCFAHLCPNTIREIFSP